MQASGGYSLVARCALLIVVASVVVEHRLSGAQASVAATHGLSGCGSWGLEDRLNSCGTRALLLCSMWDLPRSGMELMSPALAGGFFMTEPPGKPTAFVLDNKHHPLSKP